MRSFFLILLLFSSHLEAANDQGIIRSTIAACARGLANFIGKHPQPKARFYPTPQSFFKVNERRISKIATSREFGAWLERVKAVNPLQSPSALLLGVAVSPTLKRAGSIHDVALPFVDSFEIWKHRTENSLPEKEIIPFAHWHKYADGSLGPPERFHKFAHNHIKAAEANKTSGPLFYFSMSDFNVLKWRENYTFPLTKEELNSNSRIRNENFTEAELRIVLRDPEILRRTMFVSSDGGNLAQEDFEMFIGREFLMDNFPGFYKNYRNPTEDFQ